MKPIDLTPQEHADPYLATAIEAHDRAWEEVLDRQEEARDKWQTMNKEQVDKLLQRQQMSLDRYKEARASLQQKRSLACARRLRAAGGAVSVAIAGSSCESTPDAGGSGALTLPTTEGRNSEP